MADKQTKPADTTAAPAPAAPPPSPADAVAAAAKTQATKHAQLVQAARDAKAKAGASEPRKPCADWAKEKGTDPAIFAGASTFSRLSGDDFPTMLADSLLTEREYDAVIDCMAKLPIG